MLTRATSHLMPRFDNQLPSSIVSFLGDTSSDVKALIKFAPRMTDFPGVLGLKVLFEGSNPCVE